MGFMNDATSGYKKLKNEKNFTNASLCEMLKGAGLSFGEPALGEIKALLGKTFEAIVFHYDATYDVYVKVTEANIEIGKTLVPGVGIKGALAMAGSMALYDGVENKSAMTSDRAVDELYDVITQLIATGSAQSKVVSAANGGGETISYYMKERLLSIPVKYDIYDADEKPVYNVKGALTGLSYDVFRANGEQIFTIKKKIAIMPEYVLMQGKEKIGELKKKIKLSRPEIAGEINGKQVSIKGSMMAFSFSIELDGRIVGAVDKKQMIWGDAFGVDIYDESIKDIVVAIAVICDNVIDRASSND